MGSYGCGIALEEGVTTEVSIADKDEIFLNGQVSDAPTTSSLIKLLTSQPVRVNSDLSIPISGGLGASGAGAFSTAIALNEELKLKKSFNELSYAAHVAEVINRTGLGDVAGMSNGGVTIRLKPGTPFILDRIPVSARDIYYVNFGPILTRDILSDSKEKKRINEEGSKCLHSLLKKPTFDYFMYQSKEFSANTGLISSKAMDAIEAVESYCGMASMAMLGDTVFSTTKEGLEEFGKVMHTRISLKGAHLL
jgi:pantoate kinase